MVEITDRESLRSWLEGRERADAVAIAARVALRVAPNAVGLVRQASEKWASSVILPLFRANAVAWVAALGSTRSIRDSASEASNAAYLASVAYGASAVATPDASYIAANAANIASGNDVESSADLVGNTTNVAAIWKAVTADVATLQQGIAASDLVRTSLWPKGSPQPSELSEDWSTFRALLLARTGEDWSIWTDWYDARVASSGLIDPDLETARVLIPNDKWEQGPTVVNAEIRRLLNLHQSEPTQFPKVGQFEDVNRRIDADDLAEAHQISTDQQARDLHRETFAALKTLSGPASAGNNRRLETGLPALADAALAALGNAPSSVCAHTLVLKTAKFEKALAADGRRGEDPDPDRPPLEASERELLDNIVDALGFFIRTDTHLAAMQRLLRDEPTVDVPKDDVLLLVQRAVDEGAATKDAQNMVQEAIEEGGESGRRTVANFFITALKIGKAIVVGAVTVAGAGFGIAHWLVVEEARIISVLSRFYPDLVPRMLELIDLLKTLPIGKP